QMAIDLEDGERLQLKVVGFSDKSLLLVSRDTPIEPGMPDPPPEYHIDYPGTLQSGTFERGEEVNLHQWGDWLVVQGAWDTIGLYRFFHRGGIPAGYDPSLVNGSGDTLLEFSMDHFCSFESACDADPELFKLIVHVDGERMPLRN